MSPPIQPKQFRQHSAAEVEAMTPDEALGLRTQTAHHQRNVPEHLMLELQRKIGGGVMGNAAEHVGDLPHRMNQAMPIDVMINDVMPKVLSQHRNLTRPYGFGREHGENMAANKASHVDVLLAGDDYAASHRKTPVYNFPTEVAVNAASALGEQRFNEAGKHLEHLKTMQEGGSFGNRRYAPGDMESLIARPRTGTPEHKQAMVDYLRDRESRTPSITKAATSMLGGPQR